MSSMKKATLLATSFLVLGLVIGFFIRNYDALIGVQKQATPTGATAQSLQSSQNTTAPGGSFVITARPWLELLYFLSNIILCALAIYGLQQIWLLKRDIRTRNIRSAYENAANYCARFGSCVLLRRLFVRECQSAGLQVYDGKIDGFRIQSLDQKWPPIVAEKLKLDSGISALNELELIAMAFMTGIADEQEGFKTMGRGFCATIANHYDIYTVRGDKGFFQNTRALYKMWSDRISRNELEEQQKALELRLRNTTNNSVSAIGLPAR